MIFINNKEKINNIKFNNDNFYVVADFDKTITDGNSNSTWGIMASANQLGDGYTKRRTELYQKYRPVEIDPTMPDEEKLPYMEEWWKKHINLFYEYGLKEEDIKKSLMKKDSLNYRKGAKEFLKKMNDLKVPVIIISAGIGNVIESFLNKENDYYENITIISNFIKFKNGVIEKIEGETIHALNKNIVKLDANSKKKISGRNNIILLGDGLADLKMIPKSDINRAVTIGFLDEKIEESLDVFNKEFDIVLTNGGTFEDVNNILKIY